MGVILYGIGGIIFGIGLALWIVTTQLNESNTIGNSKGDRITYTKSFIITESKDCVRLSLLSRFI